MTNLPPAEPIEIPQRGAQVPWGSVLVFVLAACALAWLVALPLWLSGGLANPLTAVLLPVMMFTPTLATLLVVFLLKTPRTGRARFLGMWPLRPLRRTLGMSALAMAATFAIVFAVVIVSAALSLVRLDLVNFSGFAEAIQQSVPEGTPLPPIEILVWTQVLSLPLGAVFNSILAFGEELGWRGWLLPALRPLGVWPALLISGAVWGLWHAPIILLGYNFSRPDLTGVIFMVGCCVAWGILLGWLRLRTRSLWPAVIAHGSVNAVAGLVVLLAASGQQVDLAAVGPLGMISWAVIAGVIGILYLSGQFSASRLEAPAPAGAPS